MGNHPNSILMAIIKGPDETSVNWDEKDDNYDVEYHNFNNFCSTFNINPEEGEILIDGNIYYVMPSSEGDSSGYHIYGDNDGDILIWDYISYGYGDYIDWDRLHLQKVALQNWCDEIKFKLPGFEYKIVVTANYW